MQRGQYLERPGNERDHGSFKREMSLWPDQVGNNNKKKFKVLNKELMVVLHFLIEYFGYTMEKTYRWGETQGSWYRNLGKR